MELTVKRIKVSSRDDSLWCTVLYSSLGGGAGSILLHMVAENTVKLFQIVDLCPIAEHFQDDG